MGDTISRGFGGLVANSLLNDIWLLTFVASDILVFLPSLRLTGMGSTDCAETTEWVFEQHW
jgi:hypothetical protein